MLPDAPDSRAYRFPFLIRPGSDLPAGFPPLDTPRALQAALFLPGAEPGRQDYPPRVVWFDGASFGVIAHRAWPEALFAVPFDSEFQMELSQFLLLGWLTPSRRNAAVTLPFNTRSFAPVRQFRDLVAAACPPRTLAGAVLHFGAELDIKFRNALRDQLFPGERLYRSWFSAPRKDTRRFGPMRRHRWLAGHMLLLTSHRLIWITDDYRSRRERYGAVTRWAPAEAVVATASAGDELIVSLSGDTRWAIPLRADSAEAAQAFASSLLPGAQSPEAAASPV